MNVLIAIDKPFEYAVEAIVKRKLGTLLPSENFLTLLETKAILILKPQRFRGDMNIGMGNEKPFKPTNPERRQSTLPAD